MNGRLTTLLAVLATALSICVAAPAQADEGGTLTVVGRGFGHGRGLGQWGAFGYATEKGWDYRRILDHYYGGTTQAADVGNPVLDVELLGMRGRNPIVTGPGLQVDGTQTGSAAVMVTRQAAGAFQVWTGPGCAGPWTRWGGSRPSGLKLSTSGNNELLDNHVRLCSAAGVTGYRGTVKVVEASGAAATVNLVTADDYLRGVVPRESPASWGSAAGGAGMNALRAQAVAARSYALASRFAPYARTCDTTTCQVYGGSFTQSTSGRRDVLEDSRTTTAVRDTTGEVRRRSGAVVRTEFSASTGGWTVGGVFPAVKDAGDAVAANPNRSWTVELPLTTVATRLGTPEIVAIRVTERNGLGADGGRAVQVAVDTTGGPRTFTADQVRSRLGLKSTWFSVSATSTRAASSFVTATYHDFLGRAPDDAGLHSWSTAVLRGASQATVARAVAGSDEALGRRIDALYASALRRRPDARGRTGWMAALRAGTPYPKVMGAVYGSKESLNVLGSGATDRWVDGVYREVLGRAADPSGLAHWTELARRQGRPFVAEQLAISAEARQRRLGAYYQQVLQRAPDPAGIARWRDRLAVLGDLTVPSDLASGPEYWQKAALRFPS